MGASVFWGEWGQYNDMFRGLCGNAPGDPNSFNNSVCENFIPTGVVGSGPNKGIALVTDSVITGSEVDRWGVGFVQEIDSAAMHLFARWQHLELNNLSAKNLRGYLRRSPYRQVRYANSNCFANGKFGKDVSAGIPRSRHLPGWRRDLLLNEQTTFQIEAAPSGGFFFGTCACCRS